ncbi:MAG: hypothetical protein P9M03_08500 [Candidatus Theseobacter exili]|nr:hypothetical protein [Candidatus Theseobacter exili]
MTIAKELLEILCCPKSKVKLRPLTKEEMEAVNVSIAAGKCKYADGRDVDKQLEDGLITLDGKTVYRVENDIPVMLVENAIYIR